ncbi:MAG: hypothetical protein GW917_02795 [Bdellovibrionales bacterium]|nr:hypothetical protein [Bdellovibrionales bacterium]
MSSVGGSGSSNRQDEVVRRNREEYQSKESELVKKHHKEIRKLSEQHYSEIERLKEMHDQQMKAVQEASNKAITRRDNKYQGDIDSMRSMYMKQLKNVSQDATRKENVSGQALKADQERAQIQMESRLKALNDDYQAALAKKEELFNKNLALNKEAQERGLADQRESLETAHQKELNFLKADRDKKVADLKNEYATYRKIATEERKQQQVQNIQNQKRSSEALLSAVGKERQDRVMSENALRNGFADGLDRVRGKYEESMQENRAATQAGREYLENDIRGRIESKINRLESDNVRLKEEKIRDQSLMKQQKQREVANMRDSFSDNLKDLQRQRDEAIQEYNNKNSKDIKTVSDRYSDVLFRQSREHLQKVEDQNFEHRKDYNMLEMNLTGRAEQVKDMADRRVQGIVENTEMTKQRMLEQSQETMESMRRSHADEIRQLRFKFEEEKQQAILGIKELAQQREIKHQDEVAQMKVEHEKQVLTLQDQMRSLKKQADENLKRTVEELQRAQKVSQEQQEIRHKSKLQSLEQDHTERLKTLRRRTDERMDQFAVAVKNKS